MTMNVLFVGAHPDDIECWAGGTAARYAAEGHKLFFCVSTNGNVGSSTLTREGIAAIRHKEAKKGSGVVGAELIWLDVDDEFLFDTRETRLKFIEAFRIARPDVVFCHWIEDYNPDHSTSGRIVMIAFPWRRSRSLRPSIRPRIKSRQFISWTRPPA